MSNKQLNRRRKTQRFRPSGGMKNQLKREEPVEKGRADIEDGRVLDEPVYEKHHEAEILAAMSHYFSATHNIAEGAGAAPLAALLKELDPMAGGSVGQILSGGNLDRDPYIRPLGLL